MKSILFSIGTRGDIEPFLAIAQLLKEKDWDVICVFPEQFRETVEKMELPFIGFSKEILDMLDGKEAKMVMGGSVQEDFGHVSKLIQKAQKERQKSFRPTYGQIKNFLNPTIPEASLRSKS